MNGHGTLQRRRRHVALAGVTLALALLLAAATTGEPGSAQAPLVLKIATRAPFGSPEALHVEAFAHHIARSGSGLVEVRRFYDGALGEPAALLERVAEGTLQAVSVDLSDLARRSPAAEVLTAPGVFRDRRAALRALQRGLPDALGAMLEREGLVLGGFGRVDMEVWFSRARFEKPAAARGWRMAQPASEAERGLSEALGAQLLEVGLAQAPPMDDASGIELLSATPIAAVAAGLDRGASHVQLSDHALSASVFIYSKRWFEGLPEQLRKQLSPLPASIFEDARAAEMAMRDEILAALRARGVSVHAPGRAERRRFDRLYRSQSLARARATRPDGSRLLRAARGR
ncbi:MAG: TRAP transporter substrate-binding protein DctP [Myxococcales bacterium]|nr:TRAP transporter substrate-binding protein DctP [Myxococcales bacterium]